MARVVIQGLNAYVPQEDGTNVHSPVFLALDTDTGQVTGHLDAADAAGGDVPPDEQPEGNDL